MSKLRIGHKPHNSYEKSFGLRVAQDFRRNYGLYLMVLPVIIYFILFKYAPMYGASIAFKNYSPGLGIIASKWTGFDHFIRFFNSITFWRVLKNTFLLSLYSLVWGFPAPIILALGLNELRGKYFKSGVQTITYLPHFISLVVIIGLLKDFCLTDGLINDFIVLFGGERIPLLQKPEFFRTLYISSSVWQEIGWGSIIYLAALSGIDEQLYEAAMIDGAGRWKQTWHVTLPGISSTIVILLILRIGKLLSVGFEKIILMYNPATYEVADVISTYVYRAGLQEFGWSYSTAIGLFNSVLNFTLLVAANRISRKFSESSLW